MFFLQNISTPSVSTVLIFGTLGMLVLAIGLISFVVFHQRRIIKYQKSFSALKMNNSKSYSMHQSDGKRKNDRELRLISMTMRAPYWQQPDFTSMTIWSNKILLHNCKVFTTPNKSLMTPSN